MFFFFSKLLAFLLNPLIWIIVAVVLYIFLKNENWKKIMAYTSIGLFLFFSNGMIIGGFIAAWEVEGKNVEEVKNYDIGIVLSGMMEYNTDFDRLVVRRGADRIWQALTLYKKGKIKKILISGDSGYVLKEGLHEASQLRALLIEWGVPAKDILVEEKSRNTHENAALTSEYLKKNHPKAKLLLITSGMHMRRARACFEHEGLKFDTFSTDHYHVSSGSFSPESLLPSSDAIHLWHNFNKEWVGYMVYWIAGYL